MSLRLLAVLLFAGLAGCAPGADEVRVLRLGHGLSTDHPVHEAMTFMAEHAADASDGALRIEIYPSGQLGSERECLELLQIGSLALTKVSASVLENFAPSFQVFSLPYLFRSEAHRFTVLEGPIGREMLDDAAAYRLRGLAYYDAGARSFYTVDAPVRTPADLKGLKVRVQESQTAIRMVRTLGGTPTPISWGELYTALQQGVVDGAENNPPSFYLSRHYEVAPYYVLNAHTAVPDVLLVGTPVWDQLSAQERRWLIDSARASAEVQKRLWREATREALRMVQAEGVEVIRLDRSTRARFAEQVKPLLDAYAARPGLDTLIAAIRTIDSASVSTSKAP